MKKIVLKPSTLGTISAICAAFSGLMFGCISLYCMIKGRDLMFLPFTLIGFVGSIVMWSNRK